MGAFDTLRTRLERFAVSFQEILLQRFHRTLTIEKMKLNKNSDGFFVPILKKGQLINVEFIGQGSVLDENHPALVWTADNKSEHIIVIPLTSKDGDGKYNKRNIGIIDGYNDVESIVKINQLHSVSRKSITPVKKEVEGKWIDVHLSENQIIMMNDNFRDYHLREASFRSVIEKSIGIMLPLDMSAVDAKHFERPIQYDKRENILWYKFSDQAQMNSITLIKIRINSSERRLIVSDLLSYEESLRIRSFKIIQDRYRFETEAALTVIEGSEGLR